MSFASKPLKKESHEIIHVTWFAFLDFHYTQDDCHSNVNTSISILVKVVGTRNSILEYDMLADF
jgi:hypothetical protein